MAAAHADSMRTLGLHGLKPTQAYAAFAEAGYAPQIVRAGIAASRFRAVNTAKGPWAFLQQLTAAPTNSAAAGAAASLDSGIVASNTASNHQQQQLQQQQRQAAPAAQPALPLADVAARVQAAAEECVGADGIEAGGRFAPGAFDSLSAVELSSSLGKVRSTSS